jgi:anti-sigma-K factor RskA
VDSNERREEAQAMAALYALGALDQQTARVFETRLVDTVDGIDKDLAAFECIVVALGLSAPERRPPQSTRDRLYARMSSSLKPRNTQNTLKPRNTLNTQKDRSI